MKLLFTIGVVLVLLKILGVITMSWWLVLTPFWFPATVFGLILLAAWMNT